MPAVLLVSLLEVVQSPFPLVLAQGFEGILVSLTGLFIGRHFLFFLRHDGRENKNHRQTHDGKSHGRPPHNPSTRRWGAKKIEHTAESCFFVLRSFGCHSMWIVSINRGVRAPDRCEWHARPEGARPPRQPLSLRGTRSRMPADHAGRLYRGGFRAGGSNRGQRPNPKPGQRWSKTGRAKEPAEVDWKDPRQEPCAVQVRECSARQHRTSRHTSRWQPEAQRAHLEHQPELQQLSVAK